jgi:hypothetical protein
MFYFTKKLNVIYQDATFHYLVYDLYPDILKEHSKFLSIPFYIPMKYLNSINFDLKERFENIYFDGKWTFGSGPGSIASINKPYIEFLESFIFLHKERFCDNLRLSINVPKSERNHLIVPLSLQLLFENAIKHNIISKEKPLSISLKVEEGKRLVLTNTLQLRSNPEPGTKTGLANIKSRYEYFSDQPVIIEDTGKEFIVSLPLIQEAIITAA